MISTEFKDDIINVMRDVIFQIESSVDKDENEFLIGLLSYISNQIRIYAVSRSKHE